MTIRLLTIQHLEFLSLTGGCTGLSDSTLSKCHIVGNHMSQLINTVFSLLVMNKDRKGVCICSINCHISDVQTLDMHFNC